MKRNKTFIMILMFLCLVKLEIVHAENVYEEYKIGDKITYNGMDFYVIEASDSTSDRVTMLKDIPLTVDEVNKYGGAGTDDNHVNMYVGLDKGYYQTAHDYRGYGGMAYYTSKTCGYVGTSEVSDGCTTDYAQSEIKYVVDAWALDKFSTGKLVEDETGYSARLLTIDDLTNNLGYTREETETNAVYVKTENTPSWLCQRYYWYWTMSDYEDSTSYVWGISYGGNGISASNLYQNTIYVINPVVTIKKEPLEIKKLTDKEYKIGDIVEYNNMLFYVIKDSTEKDNSVTLLKSEPLTVDEVNKYGGVGTENNHVNMYVNPENSYYQTAHDSNGYGYMAYYTSKTCGKNEDVYYNDGCIIDYNKSEIKYVVDAWALDKINKEDLKSDATGYKVRLITFDELISDLGYDRNITSAGGQFIDVNENVPSCVYSSNYSYWTMSTYGDLGATIWAVEPGGSITSSGVEYSDNAIRPVVTLKKITEDNSENIEIDKEDNTINQVVSVPDTLLKKSIIFVVLGVILIAISTTIYILIRRKNKNKKK